MNKQRVMAIADYIESVDSKQFNMAAWFGSVVPKDLYEDLNVDPEIELTEGYDLFDYDHIHYFVDGFSKNQLECGTTACIAGWTNVYMFKNVLNYNDLLEYYRADPQYLGDIAIEQIAADYLELTPEETEWIFYTKPGSVWDEYKHEYDFKDDITRNYGESKGITNKHAADVLRRIAMGNIVYKGEMCE